ncbi:hypothetical protein ACH3XW_15745 [Acanthocheilonema viteae]
MLLLLLNCCRIRECSDSITAGSTAGSIGGVAVIAALAALSISNMSVDGHFSATISCKYRAIGVLSVDGP